MPHARVRLRGDAAATDLVGTVLLVALVVVLGSLLFLIVAATLESPAPARASFSLALAEPGATSAAVLYRNGETIDVRDLRVGYQRNLSAEAQPASITTPDPERLRPGERVSFALSPPLAADERLTVRLYSESSNVLLAELSTLAGGSRESLAPPTMALWLSVPTLPNDSVSTSILTARVSHPQGALSVARVVADLSNFSVSGATAGYFIDLNDAGLDGDAKGGDGNWSATLRVPTTTPAGAYVVRVNATDAAGSLAASASAPVTVVMNSIWAGSATTTYGNVSGGSCYNCTVLGGFRAYEGTRFLVPGSENVTALNLVNFTWDRLHPARLEDDSAVIRITDGNHSFSVYMEFGYVSSTPAMRSFRIWTDTKETLYIPKVGSSVPLHNLTINLLAPTASQQWIRSSGDPNGSAVYTNANVTEPATLIVAFMRDEEATASKTEALDVGIYVVDVRIW